MLKIWRALTQHIDQFLLNVLLFSLVISLFVLYSASGHNLSLMVAHLINMVVALGVLWFVSTISPRYLKNLAVPLYSLGVLLLIAVMLFGVHSKGAQRWLNLGIARIQPSELMKIAVPFMLAWYFASRQSTIRFFHYLVGMVIIAVPAALIVKQPDLGTALIVCASGFYVLFLAEFSWMLLLGLCSVFFASFPVLWSFMHDYQQERVLTLLDPNRDPLGTGYHIIQANIAVGSGGFTGKGWMQGTQSQLDFLPERHTDFIFAVFGEEFGFLGSVLLLGMFMIIIMRGFYIAYTAQDTFGRLLSGSITLTFFTYVFVNMGMVMGILPVVGVPLPLISYGGTSMVTLMACFGVLMSIKTHKNLVAL